LVEGRKVAKGIRGLGMGRKKIRVRPQSNV